VILSSTKAKELKVSDGEAVLLVGRRRRAAYARVHVSSKKSKSNDGKARDQTKTLSSCTVSSNMAANLRLRQGDKVKVVPLFGSQQQQQQQQQLEEEEDANHKNSPVTRSGDLLLLKNAQPALVKAVTFSPLEDSLKALESSEGGDELVDEEILERFVRPYTAIATATATTSIDHTVETTTSRGLLLALVKKGHVVSLRDANGKRLDFMITHMELEGDAKEGDEVKDGMYSQTFVCARLFIYI
jgi:hypothetical protein